MAIFEKEVLKRVIVGRVEPKIYAFSTNTVPNYLKVGDTYRPVEVRLDEWRKIYDKLIKEYEGSAKIGEDKLFRDFSVHTFLENTRNKKRLKPGTFPGVYYSKEFFKDTTVNDVKDAIAAIQKSAKDDNNHDYQLYFYDYTQVAPTYIRTKEFKPRPNQQDAINRFVEAKKAGRTNLLMYAVMRIGK